MRKVSKRSFWVFLALLPVAVFAQQPAQKDAMLEQEFQYFDLLMKLQMPDYAERVLADIKKVFPQAESEVKRRQLEPLLQQAKFDEVQAIIDKEPNPEAETTWAMRLTMADYYYAMGRYQEALGMYNAFFKKYEGTPPESIALYYRESQYKFAQMLLFLQQEESALKMYRTLLKQPLDAHVKRQVQFEAAELMVRLASKAAPGSQARLSLVDEARKACEDILWTQDLWFGRAVGLMAHTEVLRGDVEKAQKLISTYMPILRQIDNALKEEGDRIGEDLSRLSPVAECRYLVGVIMHDEAKRLLAGESPDAEARAQARDLLIGKQGGVGKSNGAYQEFVNVYAQYPGTSWAPDATQRVTEIEETLRKFSMVKSITAVISDDQKREVARRQFQNARLLFNQQRFAEALEVYEKVLQQYTENVPDSIIALSELARCYIELHDPGDAETAINELYAEMVVGYMAERFCEVPDGMSVAGDELRRIADVYEERKDGEKRRAVYDLFFSLYSRHPMAAPMLLSFAERSYKAEDWPTAMDFYERLATSYTNSPLSYDALNRISQIYRNQGNFTNEISTLERYVKRLQSRAKPGQEYITASFQLAQAHRSLYAGGLRSADADEVREANQGLLKAANMYKSVLDLLAGAGAARFEASENDKKLNQRVREGALFGQAYCMSILTEPKDKLEALKREAIKRYEQMMKEFPKSDFAPGVLMQIGTLWTTLADSDTEAVKNADAAFSRLSTDFPESAEAKMALFQRGKVLIELGYRNQGVAVLKQMFEDASRYQPYQMLTVGKELLASKEYEMALQAFDIAIKGAKDNDAVRMPAMLGRVDILIAQDKVSDAVKELDTFLNTFKRSSLIIDANLKLSNAASALAMTLNDRNERILMFNKSVDAMKLVRTFKQDDPGALARTDNDIGRILIRKAEAEQRLGDKDRETDYTRQAIAHFITVMDTGDTTNPDVVPHLERTFHTAIPLFLKIKEYADAKEYAERYLRYFPGGQHLTDVRNWLNEANIGLTSQ